MLINPPTSSNKPVSLILSKSPGSSAAEAGASSPEPCDGSVGVEASGVEDSPPLPLSLSSSLLSNPKSVTRLMPSI